MHYNTFSIAAASAVLLAASSSSAAILPVTGNNNHKAGSVARVALVRNENGQLAHLKRSGGINLERRADTASLYNALGREYFIEVGIGTPAQSFNLTLDTGRYIFFVLEILKPLTIVLMIINLFLFFLFGILL